MERGTDNAAEGGTVEPLIPVPVRSTLEPFKDQEVRDVSENLSRAGKQIWSRVPRLYIVLHSINQIHIVSAFINEEITDLGFPFTNRTLPHAFSDQTARQLFLDKQHLVLSKILDLEQGTKHYHFAKDSDVPLVKLSDLGTGGFGFVDRVRSEVSYQEYARKRIPRGRTFKKDKKILKDFENELHHLRRLSHHHIVQLVGSYTDSRFVGLIMSPIAECNLREYLNGPFEPSLVRTFFGCLAVAVRFLHENRVRHKDIKPQNVLVHRGSVRLTDFGISRDWTDSGHSTTTGPTPMSNRYCAPEVGDLESRNSSSDIWSLGCVFLEMWTVVSGHTMESLVKHLESTGACSSLYHLNSAGIASWYNLVLPTDSGSSEPLLWIQSMLKMKKEERWTIQMLSDCIQEQSEASATSFVGLCCDSRIGSPETVNSMPDELVAGQAKASSMDLSSATVSSSVGSLDFGDLVLATSSGLTRTTIHNRTPGDRKSANSQRNPPSLRNSSKRRLPQATSEPASHKRRPRQQHESPKRRESQPPDLGFGIVEGYRPYTRFRSSPDRMQKALPNSFFIVQNNRFTREQVLGFTSPSHNSKLPSARSTRLSRGSEKVLFCYSDYMLPTVAYAETCIRSKPSQYASWSTLRRLVEHMTPGVLRGYVRLCPDISEGMASIPTIIPTGSAEDEVDGMLIFGFHDSHAEGSKKYESKHEHDVQDLVTLKLKNGGSMEVEATFRVWNEDQRDKLKTFEENWRPIHLISGEWYSLMPISVTAEDAEMRALVPRRSMSDNIVTGSSETGGLEKAIQEEYMVMETSKTQKTGSGNDQRVLDLTKDLISELFYNGVAHLASARYFILKDTDRERVEASQAHGIWSSTPSLNAKLDRAFKSSGTFPIIAFIILAGEGFFGIVKMRAAVDRSGRDHFWLVPTWKAERFQIEWFCKAQVSFSKFRHIRVKDNFEGSNNSTCVNSCQNGTELSQCAGIEILRVFETLHGSICNPSDSNWAVLEDRWTLLMNPQSSIHVDLRFIRSIPLDSEDGDYGLTISPGGQYVAAGYRVVEVFRIDTGMRIWKFDLSNKSDVIHGVSFNHNSTDLAAGGECGVIYVWDLLSELLLGTLTGHTDAIFSLEYTANGSRIVSGSIDRTVRIWDAQLLRIYVVLSADQGCVTISSSLDCSHVFAGTLNGELISWEMNSDSNGREAIPKRMKIHDDSTYGIQYLPKLNGIVTGSRDKSVKLWPTGTTEESPGNKEMSKPLRKFLGHKDSVYAVDASPDNRIIFSASGDGSLRLWNSESGEAIAIILGVGLRRFLDLSVCQTRNLFTTAGYGEGLQIWSYNSGP